MTRRATKASKVILTKYERDYLERLVRRRKVSRGEAQRAEIVLCAANGLNNRAISDAVGVARDTVRLWRERFPNIASTASMTSPDAARHARSGTIASKRSSP
jgi:Homeodomain-like domain